MTSTDLINTVFATFYETDDIPNVYGGSSDTNIFRVLMSIVNTLRLEINAAKISNKWIDGSNVTWYTKFLVNLLRIPRFPGETDTDFLARLSEINTARLQGGQSEDAWRTLVNSLVSQAITNPTLDIRFLAVQDVASLWKDPLETADIYWNDGATWADNTDLLRSTVVIEIQFANTGVDTDPINYEYWAKSENYTKIYDLVKLFKAPGIDFELRLLSP